MKWIIERIVSLRIHLIMTTYPFGNPPKLPDYIKNNRQIIALKKIKIMLIDTRTISAFSGVLILESTNSLIITATEKPKELFQDYCQYFQVNPKDFKRVELTDFPQLEKHYETRLFVMFLKEDGTAKALYLSQASFPSKIYMNVYENQLSLITDHKMYSKQYTCSCCDKLFARMENLNKHLPKYDGTVEYAYPGGVYKNKLSAFEEQMSVRVRQI